MALRGSLEGPQGPLKPGPPLRFLTRPVVPSGVPSAGSWVAGGFSGPRSRDRGSLQPSSGAGVSRATIGDRVRVPPAPSTEAWRRMRRVATADRAPFAPHVTPATFSCAVTAVTLKAARPGDHTPILASMASRRSGRRMTQVPRSPSGFLGHQWCSGPTSPALDCPARGHRVQAALRASHRDGFASLDLA